MAIRTLVQTASEWPHISLRPFFVNSWIKAVSSIIHGKILSFSNGCIVLTIGSINTKLGDFVKLGLHFTTVWINS